MADYTAKLKTDLVEQFKDKPIIAAFIETVGEQFDELLAFLDDLNTKRTIQTAEGKQLDGIGDIVVLSRKEGGELALVSKPTYVLTDDEYRRYLYYKIWKNSCDCTYSDIMKCIRMFWDLPLYYSESIDNPATITLETDLLTPDDDITNVMRTPFIKAGGVGINIVARIETPTMDMNIWKSACGALSICASELPENAITQTQFTCEQWWLESAAMDICISELPERTSKDASISATAYKSISSALDVSRTLLRERGF